MPLRTLVASAVFALACCFSAATEATSQRTAVAPNGSDANPCTIASPCRSFGAAIAQTLSGGEVIVLDSAGYGPVTITQPVSIISPDGIYAGITVGAGNGITINDPSAVVTLRGLTINGQGGADGIAFQQGTRLTIERCTITGMSNRGINITASGSFTAIADTLVSRNAFAGIGFTGDVRGSLVRVRAEAGGVTGILAEDGATVAITDSEASRNISSGVRAMTSDASTTTVSIDRLTATGNQSGVDVGAAAPGSITLVDVTRANLSGNTIDGVEIYGPSAFGTAIASIHDSLIAGNGLRGAFMSAPSSAWTLTLGNNRIINHSGAGVLLFNNIGTLQSRGDNTIVRNNPNISGAVTSLGGL